MTSMVLQAWIPTCVEAQALVVLALEDLRTHLAISLATSLVKLEGNKVDARSTVETT